MSYSQNSEEQTILDHFGDRTGTFLEIGAFDGVTLSNCRALAEKGWKGVLIEPSPKMFEKLVKNYEGFSDMQLLDYGIGDGKDHVFYDNVNGLGTTKKSELDRWVGSGQEYVTTSIKTKTFDHFFRENIFEYLFISLDAEGMDYEILTQMDLTHLGCEMLCVEWNSIDKDKYVNYVADYGMKLKAENAENLIFVK